MLFLDYAKNLSKAGMPVIIAGNKIFLMVIKGPGMSSQQREIYLDNNATTPVLPVAAQAAMHTMQRGFGNPSSSHATGIKAKAELEKWASSYPSDRKYKYKCKKYFDELIELM